MSSVLSKICVTGLCVCTLCSTGFSQKNPKKIVELFTKTPSVTMREMVPFPARMLGNLPSANQVFQQSIVAGLERVSAQEALAPATVARRRALATQTVELAADIKPKLDEKKVAYVYTQTEPIRRYLDTHDNTWPQYQKQDSHNRVLRQIRNFMEVENPSPEVLAIEREIIRMRQHSRARTPQEVRTIVDEMMAYRMVPSRAYAGFTPLATEEELALGEDLAFAIAAYRVPMENNPWQIEGMAQLIDKATTYYAMRRVSPMFEGLPTLHEEEGIYRDNFFVWTRGEFTWRKQEWVHQHPFEYDLAVYREKEFGPQLAQIYNNLCEAEKKAIMFHAPDLPTQVDEQIAAEWYDKACLPWAQRELRSFLPSQDAAGFEARLSWAANSSYRILFVEEDGNKVLFKDLPYEEQLEVLRWAWQTYRLSPRDVLKVLYK